MSKVLSYFKKREELLEKLKLVNTSMHFRKLLVEAIVQTDLCMKIYKDLVTSLGNVTKYLGDEKVKFDLRREQFKTRGEEAELRISEITNEEYRAMVEDDARKIQESVKSWEEITIGYNLMLHTDLEIGTKHAEDSLFDDVFGSNETDVIWSSLKTFMEVILGLTIIGNIVAGLQAIDDIFKKRKQLVKDADTELGKIENYNLATDKWSWLTQSLIDFMDSLPTKQHVPIEESLRRVEQKKHQILKNMFPTDPEADGQPNT